MKKHIICISALLAAGCSDYLAEQSQNKFYPTSTEHYTALLMGEYTVKFAYPVSYHLMTDQVQGRTDTEYAGLKADNYNTLLFTWAKNVELLSSGNRTNANNTAWSRCYNTIASLNHIIEEIDNADGAKNEKMYIEGEARFARAMNYFLLANIYGEPYESDAQAANAMGVPLKTDIGVKVVYDRNSLAECYAQILGDLNAARGLIAGSGVEKSILHPGIRAVDILLSRVHLFMGNYGDAVSAATSAIAGSNLRKYTRDDSVSTYVLRPDNPEIVYSYGTGAPYETSLSGGFVASDELLALYDRQNDMRFRQNFLEQKHDKGAYHYYSSNKDVSSTLYGNNMRIAEAYLNRAEAYARADKLAEATADVRTLLQYRCLNVTYTIPSTKTALIAFILDERQREFCFEECFRWFDLRRIGSGERPEVVHHVTTISPDGFQRGEELYTLLKNDPNYTMHLPFEELQRNVMIRDYERFEKLVSSPF